MTTVAKSYAAYLTATKLSRDLVTATSKLPALQHNLVYEMSFLRAVIAWEALVEEVFVTYLMRRPARGGALLPSALPSRAVNQGAGTGGITFELAGRIVTGDRQFVDWLQPNVVEDRSKKWFPNDTTFKDAYAAFADPGGDNKIKPFEDIVVVRNRIAHSSGTAAAKFAALRSRVVANPNERRGMGPGQFLKRNYLAGPDNWFEVHLKMMETAADQLTA